ncbi:hypothetical protein [Crocosphaera sp. XPORK-15E]|uniref:hypothetical protein n=1 Tax=Crocosphaera sp. XPORK-15E TaxID=3110247 RepID=UPI002B1F1A6B|nr:hypothetical protein [Crocosphaera sp. XPORK-15E]MEA5534018.1 hypothetical protein [Crocosphaera sp. XPORK-15E]
MMIIIDARQPAVKLKKAVIFIPGFKYHGLSNFLLDKIQRKYKFFQAYRELTQDNLQIKQVELTTCILDIYEVDWTEDIPKISSNNLQKLFLSIWLLGYWTFSRIWSTFRNSPLLVIYSLLSLIILIIWIIANTLLLIIILINFTGQTSVAFLSIISDNILDFINSLYLWCLKSTWINIQWFAWGLVIAWLFSFSISEPINLGLELSHFTKEYLKSNPLRISVRNRVLSILNPILSNQDYDEIIIIAHSFGVVIGAESLGHTLLSCPKPVKFISFGNNLVFLSKKESKLIENIVSKCLANLIELNSTNQLDTHYWIDYWAEFDWFCTKIPLKLFKKSHLSNDTIRTRFQRNKVFYRINNILNLFTGKYHLIYFEDESYVKNNQGEPIGVLKRIFNLITRIDVN